MSENVGGNKFEDSNKPMSADVGKFKLTDDMCDRVDCPNKATKKPVVHLRASPMMTSEEVVIGVKVCDKHAAQKDADDLISDAGTKGTMQIIFKAQRGEDVDWSCSGVVWADIN